MSVGWLAKKQRGNTSNAPIGALIFILLVFFRWWNYINDEGVSVWVFEARPQDSQNKASTTEARSVWTCAFVCVCLAALV